MEDGKEKISVLYKQYIYLKKEGYPDNYGLYENGLLFRKHNDTNVVKISDAWWNSYMSLSKRDQHCLCYVFWKLNFTPELLLPRGFNTRNHPGFIYKQHLRPFKLRLLSALRIKRNQFILFFIKIGWIRKII